MMQEMKIFFNFLSFALFFHEIFMLNEAVSHEARMRVWYNDGVHFKEEENRHDC